MTKKVNGQSYREWRTEFLAANNLTLPMDLATRRDLLYSACPNGYFPSIDHQRWTAFLKMDASADRKDGQVYLADQTAGTPKVAEYEQLEFDDFRSVCIRRASLAAGDFGAIYDMVVRWAAKNRPNLDVDAFMDDVKRTVGL